MMTGVVAAFLLGVLVEAMAFAVSDRRAIAREAAFWEELRAQALDGYGQVFDWARDTDL